MAQSKCTTKPSLVFTVTRQAPEYISPAKLTPYEFKELSDIDDQGSLRFHIPIIQIYRNDETSGGALRGQDPAKVLKEAVSKALVFYYPLAGRLREKAGGKLVVECNGEGILFIEAYADVTLHEFGDNLVPPFPCLDELLFDVPGSTELLDTPLMLIQVTKLKCGGFIVGLRYNHTFADAPGLVLLMNAIAELAPGLQSPSTLPVWDRHIFSARTTPQVTYHHHEYDVVSDLDGTTTIPTDEPVHKSFFFGPKEIVALRRFLPAHQKATTFELLSAFLWRCRTIALRPDAEELVRFICLSNFRYRFPHLFPSGYYGNGFGLPVAISTASKLTGNPIEYAVNLVQKAKEAVTPEFVNSLPDFLVLNNRPCFTAQGAFLVSDVTKAGLENVDYGWGLPVYSGPAKAGFGNMMPISFNVAFKNEKGEKGILVLICLPEDAMQIFVKEINGLLGLNAGGSLSLLS
ncbi:benzyl alcohol O-benzoyltransferase-like isoform X2 [Amaranthus tricolor]|uniref:benzyl alcohol O-benzoyltransferase-like isoform X2 n=1 Tax=Amaranthus tricolor TaxID=29722 RepID=UPI0025882A03|nr:benzyl alcohol O-benzoyltransferase-like isoform X2 [Amaranthus tricolor]